MPHLEHAARRKKGAKIEALVFGLAGQKRVGRQAGRPAKCEINNSDKENKKKEEE